MMGLRFDEIRKDRAEDYIEQNKHSTTVTVDDGRKFSLLHVAVDA